MLRRRSTAILTLALLAAGGCAGGHAAARARTRPRAEASARAGADPREAAIEQLAADLMTRASADEPSVSHALQEIATRVHGRLAGFEHRLKTRESTIRKIHAALAEDPGVQVRDVVIDDALRYTLEVADTPPGNHAAAIRAAFEALEKLGHRVSKVKNYWPRGDNYSGVNSVLIAPDGLPWELQFHTPESFRIKQRDHILYEEMREQATPPARKRALYRQLAAPWESVPIPQKMLAPRALHRQEEIILRPPP